MGELRKLVPFLRRRRERHGSRTSRGLRIGRLAFVLFVPFDFFFLPGPRVRCHWWHLRGRLDTGFSMCLGRITNSQ